MVVGAALVLALGYTHYETRRWRAETTRKIESVTARMDRSEKSSSATREWFREFVDENELAVPQPFWDK